MNIIDTWWLEPAFVTVGFGFFINWYWYYERIYHVSVSSTLASTIYWDGNGPLLQSLASYWIGIYIWTYFIPPASTQIPSGLPRTMLDLGSFVLQVVLGIVYYDAIFFVVHWMMHEMPFLRQFHARHHDYYEIHECNFNANNVNPTNKVQLSTDNAKQRRNTAPVMMECRQTLCHSLIDGTLQVLVNILVQRKLWIPFCGKAIVKSRLARTVHNIIVIWMLTESHSAAPAPYVWRKYFVGCREHYLHHTVRLTTTKTSCLHNNDRRHQRQQRVRYQQFFGYLDDLRFAVLDRNLPLFTINLKGQKSA